MKMNAKPVGCGANPISRIKIVGEVDGYVDEMLRRGASEINNVANLYCRNVRIAQPKGADTILVNADGPYTSTFSKRKLENGRDFLKNIIHNIRINGEVSKNRMDTGLTIIA